MALVAYENSDSSEYEDDENTATVVLLNKKVEDTSTDTTTQIDSKEPEHQSLFNLLPQPSSKKPEVIEEDDEFLHKKADIQKPKAKITVPSLSDFKDVRDTVPNVKPRAANGKKSGLLSILPQPKNGVKTTTTKSLIPHVLTTKPNTVKKKVLHSPSKKAKTETKILSNDSDNDSDNDDDVQNDFFSINKPADILPDDVILDIDTKKEEDINTNVATNKRSIQSFFKQDVNLHQENSEPGNIAEDYFDHSDASSSQNGEINESSNTGEIALDDEAIMKLCGTRGKRKRQEIQVVDVNQQEVLAEARQMLLKGIMDDTSKRMSSSKKRGNEPTNQQKRKHQITYLAHQAKAQEAELQNQWANNRMTKRQTQSKYGF